MFKIGKVTSLQNRNFKKIFSGQWSLVLFVGVFVGFVVFFVSFGVSLRGQ